MDTPPTTGRFSTSTRGDRQVIPVIATCRIPLRRGFTSTKGPGVYPGHRRTSPSRRFGCARYLNEGTGSLSRSFVGRFCAVRLSVTSTKGPGVYPGHASSLKVNMPSFLPQRRDREFIPVMPQTSLTNSCCKRPQRRDREFIPVISSSDNSTFLYRPPQRRDREFIPVMQAP